MEGIKLSKSNKLVKKILAATFPEYAGRKIKLEARETYHMLDYWDGGTRYYVKAVDLRTGVVIPPGSQYSNPFRSEAHSEFTIPEYAMLVEHCIFCGRDLGIRLYVHPSRMPKFLKVAN